MKILHLEDSSNDAELIGALVREAWPRCDIRRVANGPDFRAALAGGDCNLILSDFAIPGFDGMSALELARRIHPAVPFIFISGTIGEERAIEALRRGAADYVIKDRPGRLVPAIQQALRKVEEEAALRRAETALQENRERQRLLVEQARDVIFTLSPAGDITSLNPAFEVITGWRRADWLGRRFYRLIGRNDLPAALRHFQLARAGEALAAFELKIRKADGGTVDIELTVTPNAGGGEIMGIGRDVTERKRALAKIHEQAEIIDKAPVAVVIADLSHRVTYCNEGAVALYGRPRSAMLGRTADELFPPQTMKLLAAGREAALTKGTWRGEIPVPGPHGESQTVEFFMDLIRDDAGQPRARLSIGVDVTEKRKLESQLQQAERLDSIGMLAGGVAHDLNNALAPILMSVELLRPRLTDEKDQRVLNLMLGSAEHGAALVRQLLAFARGEEGERTEVRAGVLVADVRKLLRSSMPQNITLETQCDPAPWPIHADAVQLKQVLINLGLNARDAMPEGGRIEIRAENVIVDVRQARAHPGAEAGAHLCLSVRDTGTGIPPAILGRIFDPFFTTKERGKGTGLGLTMTAGIVKGHQGILEVESESGQGTVFRLYFPCRTQGAVAPGPAEAPRGAGENLLLIEDDRALRETCQSFLEAAGYRVQTTPDAAAGLRIYESSPGAFAVVITDLMMPGLGGRAVIAAIRQRSPQQAILCISGLLDAAERQALDTLDPPVDSLDKPIAAEHLLVAIRRAVERGHT